ncbi:MAG: AraC family transcriptional regulator [Candidatus Faecousia sp.]|nr:AraC family transcriptional regulator [Candidatus Faecousia sp.]
MIRNLNQVNFRSFGSVLPERASSIFPFPKEAALSIHLDESVAPMYQAAADTWVAPGSGMSILSVRKEEGYLHFYLDKPVCLKAGAWFALSAFKGSAAVLLYAQDAGPDFLGTQTVKGLREDRQLHVDGIYTFFYQEKEQGFLFPGEAHPMPELTYVDQGSLHSVVNGQDLLLKQGDLVIYGPDQWHMQYADIGVAPRFVTISFDAGGLALEPLLDRKFTAPQQVATLLQSMLREQEHMDGFSTDIIVSQLTLLLLHLLREAVKPTGSKVKNANVVQNENEIIRRAQQFVAAHICEKLSVPMVASQVGVSPSYLTVLFHKNLQISPGEYIRRIKLQESKQMIRENNLNFTQIASALQYSTVHHFSRQFKEKFGITPTEYAKSVR